MAENLHNDPFEEFLKKSLAEHKEPAPADMWGRIEEQLPAPPVGGTWLGLHRGAWWAVAAALLVAVATWQFVRYEHRIGQLEAALHRQQDSIAQLRARWFAIQRYKEPTMPRYEVTPEAEAAGQRHRLSANAAPTASPSFPAWSATAGSSARTGATRPAAALHPPTVPAPRAPEPGRLPAPPAALKALKTGAIHYREPAQRQVLPPALPVLRAPRRSWAAGITRAAMQGTRQLTRIAHHPYGPAKEFSDSSRIGMQEAMTGLDLEVPLNGRWHLYMGLMLRQSDYSLAHTSELAYGESVPLSWPGSGGMPWPHDPYQRAFFYNLNTAAGVLDLRVAVQPTDTTQNVAPSEQIGLDVHLQQRISQVVIPLALQYRYTKGRMGLGLRAGLQLNLRTDSRTKLEVHSLHPAFNAMADRSVLSQPYSRNLYVEWTTSLQAHYRIAPRWRIETGPLFAGLLTSPHKAWYIQTKGWSVGWSASLQRLF